MSGVAAGEAGDYGLRSGVLEPVEALAQSVSTIAPSASACLLIPVVFAMAGNATWFVYVLATGATLLVGFCVSRFARMTASPGSLYTYAADTLPPVFGAIAAWGLLLAYLAGGASAVGGTLYFATVLAREASGRAPSAVLVLVLVCVVAGYIAFRDVQLSARLMLWIEAASMSLILLLVMAVLPARFGMHLDLDQFRLKGLSLSGLGPALVLSMLSFAGFESAAALGGEVRQPLRSIPRVVVQCAILSGAFFILCAYSEVLGFRGEPQALSNAVSPLHLLAARAGIPPLGTCIDLGAMMSMFACALASVTAAARVLMKVARGGLLPTALERTSRRHGTPGVGIALSAGLMLAVTVVMALRGVTGSGMVDLLGSLAAFGFLTAYALVAAALPFARRALGRHSHWVAGMSVLTVAVMILIAIFDLISVPDPAHARIPYIYLACLAVGIAWYKVRRKAMESVVV